jgi:hypothetical protein
MTDKELKKKLAKIGYTTLWLDYGVLTIDYLTEQEQNFDNSDDQHTEHYRYHTLRRYLSDKDILSDIEFENYLSLVFEDNDQLMAGSAAADLFNKIDLTDFQFEKLCKLIGHFGVWTEVVVSRQSLLRKLKAGNLTKELFRECLVNGDSVIQEYIVDIADLNQLEELAKNGNNKKIRNIATEKVQRLKRQK